MRAQGTARQVCIGHRAALSVWWTPVLALVVGLAGWQIPSAQGAIDAGASTLDYSISHDPDGASPHSPSPILGTPPWTVPGTPGGGLLFSPAHTDTFGTGGAGSSAVFGGFRILASAFPAPSGNDVIRPQVHQLTSLTQDDPLGEATDRAQFRMDFDGTLMFDGVAFNLELPLMMNVNPVLGAGAGAYTQFEMYARVEDSGGAVLLEERIGGSLDICAGPVPGGAGRFTAASMGIVPPGGLVVANFDMLGIPGDQTDPCGVGPAGLTYPPFVYIPFGEPYATIEGFIELLAHNDGGPTGITVSDIPEPNTLGLLLLGGLALLGLRPCVRRIRVAR